MSCETCKSVASCIQFPIVLYNLNNGKTYANGASQFKVDCPDGSSTNVTIPASTIVFTWPYPVGYQGDYPPLILVCPSGGTIIKTIPSGSTQAEIDVIINSAIYQCAQSIAVNQVNCSTGYPSAAVTHVITCGVGTTLSYSGTLPAWIKLDSGTGTLTGIAGAYVSHLSEADATAQAQAALDAWVAAAIAAGSLVCQAPGCNPPSSFPTIGLGVYALTDELKYASATATLWTIDSGTGHLFVYDAATQTLAQDIDLNLYSGGWGMIYDSVNGQMVVLTNDATLLFINETTFAIVSVASGLNTINGFPLAYDSTRGHVLAVDVETGAFIPSSVRLFNCATHTQIASNDQALTTLTSPTYVPDTDGFYLCKSDSTYWKIDPVTLAFTDLAVPPPLATEFPRFQIYIPTLKKLAVQTRIGAINSAGVRLFDVLAGTWSNFFTGPDILPWPGGQFGILWLEYNDCNGLLYFTNFTDVLRVDPVTLLEVDTQPQVDCFGMAFDHPQNLMWVRLDTTIISIA